MYNSLFDFLENAKSLTIEQQKIQTSLYSHNAIDETSVKENKDLFSKTELMYLDFENIALNYPEINVADLLFKEELSISTAKLIELVGAVQDVAVYRNSGIKKVVSSDSLSAALPFEDNVSFDKSDDKTDKNTFYQEIKKRKTIWKEVDKYELDKKNVDTLFSKSTISLYLLLHALPLNANGNHFDVSISQIANKLNVTTKTICNNLDRLVSANFLIVDFSRSNDLFSYHIVDYDARYDKYKAGYIKMPKNVFLKLLTITDVNALRLALRMYLRFVKDYNQLARFNKMPSYTLTEIRSILPRYVTHKKAVISLIEMISSIFECKLISDTLFFNVPQMYNHLAEEERIKRESNQIVLYLLKYVFAVLSKKDKEDVYQLVKQYSLHAVKLSIDKLLSHQDSLNSINNKEVDLGIVLRFIIKQLFSIH